MLSSLTQMPRPVAVAFFVMLFRSMFIVCEEELSKGGLFDSGIIERINEVLKDDKETNRLREFFDTAMQREENKTFWKACSAQDLTPVLFTHVGDGPALAIPYQKNIQPAVQKGSDLVN